jgi:diguanylate cyclase (GGDEF)-like protein
MVAKTLTKNARSFDLVGRWGGEEFICVIANTNKLHLFNLGERFRKLIAYSTLTLNNNTISITISVGGTIAIQDDTIETIVRRADIIMYQSKTCGRNCVTLDC